MPEKPNRPRYSPLIESEIKHQRMMRELRGTQTQNDLGVQNAEPPARHSPDFRSVRWYGTDYTFTATQAAIVKELWHAWEQGTPDVGAETLLEAVDSKTSRLVDIFRGNPAWGTMIVDGSTKGSKRLADPSKS